MSSVAYRWRGLSDAELEELRASARVVSPAEQERREKIASRRKGQAAWNRGHRSGSDAGEGAEGTGTELFLRAPCPPGSGQRTEEQRYPQAGSFLASSTGMARAGGIEKRHMPDADE